MTKMIPLPFAVFLAVLTLFSASAPNGASAQNAFAPAIHVNDKVITRYELRQRTRLLQLFRAKGDPRNLARQQLIEERIKLGAAEAVGLVPTEKDVQDGMTEFAGRVNLPLDKFLAILKQAGISRESYRDFIIAGVAWRQLVRAKFGPRIRVSDADIDRAVSHSGGGAARVNVAEILLKPEKGQEKVLEAQAKQIGRARSFAGFSTLAKKYSKSDTADQGGVVGWVPVISLPPQLHGILPRMRKGQVTPPVRTKSGIVMYQLRGFDDGKGKGAAYSAIEYAAYYIEGGKSDKALARARKIRATVDSCDDLYGIAKGQPESVLERGAKKPSEIPADIRRELDLLDKGEASFNLTRSGGKTLVFLMMCGRSPVLGEGLARDNITLSLQNRRLASYASGYLQQLRAEARIVEK